MGKEKFYAFQKVAMYFTKDNMLLYKVSVDRIFSDNSTAKDRMAVASSIIGGIKEMTGLELVRRKIQCDFITYECSDEEFEICLELHKASNGESRMVLSVTNKKVREGKIGRPGLPESTFNADDDIEISI